MVPLPKMGNTQWGSELQRENEVENWRFSNGTCHVHVRYIFKYGLTKYSTPFSENHISFGLPVSLKIYIFFLTFLDGLKEKIFSLINLYSWSLLFFLLFIYYALGMQINYTSKYIDSNIKYTNVRPCIKGGFPFILSLDQNFLRIEALSFLIYWCIKFLKG